MSATLGEYKGSPTIELDIGRRKPYTFGLVKARAILDNIDAIEGFVASGGAGLGPDAEPTTDIDGYDVGSEATHGTRSTVTRFSSGAEVFTNVKGRCEDAPCCGCCS